ncbi:hypothetical protein, partial [Vibrio breoganii]|uniref:hypothetical protein n=1 Tax=Vibrio breoganii TaxID=553239 RepID=UPI001A7E12C0
AAIRKHSLLFQDSDMKKPAIKAGFSNLKPGDVLLPHGRCGDPQTHATFPRFRYDKAPSYDEAF